MSLAIVYSRANAGIHALPVTIEIHLSPGLPGFNIVGLPETAVKESRERVRSALLNTKFSYPVHRITVNLAPADLPKEGSRYDLPIALGILCASGQIPKSSLENVEIVGELALSGEIRPVDGVLPIALAARNMHRKLIIPSQNASEASLVKNIEIIPTDHISDLCQHFFGHTKILPYQHPETENKTENKLDLRDVRGQAFAKRALEIAASGGHHLLMTGPPGSGKSMLAHRFPTLLPPLREEEALEAASIYSITGKPFLTSNWRCRPFRAPHHTASAIALSGGGNPPRPGEISLSHQGILFLDELPEFHRHTLEILREPLESGQITISRAAHQETFPAKFQLIAAMNPCPCGQFGNPHANCRCSPDQIKRYQGRLSGPLLDRIDLFVQVPLLKHETLFSDELPEESSEMMKLRVTKAQEKQFARQNKLNQGLSNSELELHCSLSVTDKKYLLMAAEKLQLSARATHRVIRVARTIADLNNAERIELSHIQEAMMFRMIESGV